MLILFHQSDLGKEGMSVSQNNNTQRVAYIVSYNNKAILKRLEKMPVSVSYVSVPNRQVLIYMDKRFAKDIENQLKKTKGFKAMEESVLFQEDVYNF